MQKSEQIGKLAEALANVQAQLEVVPKDSIAKIQSQKGSYSYEYLSFGTVWDVCRPLLAKNGLAVCQPTEISSDGRDVIVETILMHSSGEWLSGRINLPITQNTPQAVGSAITYGRRYSFASMIGIVSEEDDDGQSAAKPPSNQTNKPNNVTPMPSANNKVVEYRQELISICKQLKYDQESEKKCLNKFDSLKTENEKYSALIKMREKLAEYKKAYSTQDDQTKSILEVAQEQDAKPKLTPRELAAIQIYEGLRDENSQVKLTVVVDGFTLFCPNDKDDWQDFNIKHVNEKTTCNCTAFTSISATKPEFLCEHINGVNNYLEWKKAFEAA